MDFFTAVFYLINLKSVEFEAQISKEGELTAEKLNTIVEEFVSNNFYEYSYEDETNQFFEPYYKKFSEAYKKLTPSGYETPKIPNRSFYEIWMKYVSAYYNSSDCSQKVHLAKCDTIFAEVISIFVNGLPKTVFINENEWSTAGDNMRRNVRERNIAYENARREFIESIELQNIAYQIWYEQFKLKEEV